MIVLGIETSCDETAAALVNSKRTVLSESIHSQLDIHNKYLGIVPELAARSHVEYCDKIIIDVLEKAKLNVTNIDAVAATAGPGLIGGLLVGLTTAKSISFYANKPFIAVNHLAAHALTPRFTNRLQFPYLLLLISGGHTLFLSVEGPSNYFVIGTSIDDALGEAFDKTARLLGLGYPGGASLEKLAKLGDPDRFDFPLPLKGRKTCNFSFSGLKTSVRYTAEKLGPLKKQDKADIAASFQKTICKIIKERTTEAIKIYLKKHPTCRMLAASGGVASNKAIKSILKDVTNENNFSLVVPPPKLCTDNGVMVAWAGLELGKIGVKHDYNFDAKARWSLEEID